jgi:hypothetical protein
VRFFGPPKGRLFTVITFLVVVDIVNIIIIFLFFFFDLSLFVLFGRLFQSRVIAGYCLD